MARIERGLRSRSRRMEIKVSIQLSGTNSLMRVEKRKEELSQKRYSWIKMHSRSWESSSSRFRLCPTAERSRSAGSTPTSAYGMGNFLLSLFKRQSVFHWDSLSETFFSEEQNNICSTSTVGAEPVSPGLERPCRRKARS